MFKEFKDFFSWGYKDLKSYDTNIIQHKIPLKENQKPFKQKLRRINPLLLPLVKEEIEKMHATGIIVPIRYSEWVSNLVSVRKKTWEIRLCIDFRNLNRASLKDNYQNGPYTSKGSWVEKDIPPRWVLGLQLGVSTAK